MAKKRQQPSADPPPARADLATPPDDVPEETQGVRTGTGRWAFEVHNSLVNFVHGDVSAASEEEAREIVTKWLTAGLSVREA